MSFHMWYDEAASWLIVPLRNRAPPPLPTDYQMAFIWNVAFALALSWIVYRIYEIYQKPLADLVDVLGIDIPPIPDVSLAGITTDSALLYWKPPDTYHAPLRHFIQVNGINVGEFNRSDASVQVTGLQPGCYYSVRAIATNAANFSSLGPLIRLRTVPLSGHEQRVFCTQAPRESDIGGLRATNLAEDSSPNGLSHNMPREYGGTQHLGKRTVSGRRNSPAASSADNPNGQIGHSASANEEGASEETIPQLTKKLDMLRHQQEEIDRQSTEEEEETERSKVSLIKERDILRQILKEKEEAQLEFKKQVNELEKHSKAAQRKKSAKERLLYQKQAERQKMRDDISRWDQECSEMCKEAQAMESEEADLNEVKENKIVEIRKNIDDCQAANKAMEEEIHVKGNQIKMLEKERKKSDSWQNDEEEESERLEREREQVHESRMHECQAQYSTLWKSLQQAEAENQHAQDCLAYWLGKRARDPSRFAPIPGLDFSPAATNSQRRLRQGPSRTSTVSYSSSGYPSGTAAFNSISSVSPTFPSTSPFFNMNNGTTASNTIELLGISQGDADAFMGGAPMSPTANMLLPSNLLRDDDSLGYHPPAANDQDGSKGAGVMSSTLYRQTVVDNNSHGPQSPSSDHSPSPSLLSSPHDSQHNLQGYYPSSDPFAESDKRSNSCTTSPFTAGIATETNPIAARRLAGFFNFNRQRGKSSAHELPPLGTLKQGQSQSFPRNLEQGAFDPVGSGRRRVSSGTWANPMANLLARGIASPHGSGEGDGITPGRNGPDRRSRLHIFGSKLAPVDPSTRFDRSSSPRPSSTYSFENILPRPSSESQPFGWSIPDSVRQRHSPLAVDWSTLGGPWSRNNSRRPSVQHGSSSNLSLGSTPLEPDDYQPSFGKHGSTPAPIGTERFQISQRPITPKLNPAAPSFTTRLFTRNDAKRASKGEKINEKIAERAKNREMERSKDGEADPGYEDSSPPNSRLSRDAHSIVTATSRADSHDSLEQSTSATPSDNVASSAPKESLMQRITRKGSSSKFNVPWAKDRGNLFSKKVGEPSTPDEVEEDAASDYHLGKSVESTSSTPQHEKGNRGSISWTNIMRKSKKGEKAMSESSERADETETGEDD